VSPNLRDCPVTDDPYRLFAGFYDRLLEPMNRGLRVLGFRMYLPSRGARVLDVGCGTGLHLDMYRKFDCDLYGVDSSSSMLQQARARLGNGADLRHVDATHLPYESGYFDLVISMLVLHEMDADVRSATLGEMRRVLKSDGRVLVIDYHAGTPSAIRGWVSKLVIGIFERAAGRRHYRNYRRFAALGGLPAVLGGSGLEIQKTKVVDGNTLALYLLRGM
jgi:ubiquinone/menaquinone biosynthesis C-methylase UbiE